MNKKTAIIICFTTPETKRSEIDIKIDKMDFQQHQKKYSMMN